MAHRARLDGAVVLHHVVVRGIERLPLFCTNTDRADFVHRLAGLTEQGAGPRSDQLGGQAGDRDRPGVVEGDRRVV